MYSRTAKGKNPKGSVGIEVFRGRLRLRLSRTLYNGKQKYLSTELLDNPNDWNTANALKATIEADIRKNILVPGSFDHSLVKYGRKPSNVQLAVIECISRPGISLAELWEKFVAYKSTHCSPNTMHTMYGTYSKYLKKLPTHNLDEAEEIRDWVLQNIPLDSAKRFITRLSACCDWSIKSKLTDTNPFKGMAAEIKLPKPNKETEDLDINPFTIQERDAIVKAIRENTFCNKHSGFKHSHYAPYIQFLFMTGCRPSEAIALQWKHIAADFKFIYFEQAIVYAENGRQLREGLKTQERRRFPCNPKLQSFLQSIKSKNSEPESLIFPGYSGTWLDVPSFRKNVWKPILKGLGIEYRKPYQTRHTFITLALENGLDAKDVARLVGNSAEVIYRHYAGNKRELFVPEF